MTTFTITTTEIYNNSLWGKGVEGAIITDEWKLNLIIDGEKAKWKQKGRVKQKKKKNITAVYGVERKLSKILRVLLKSKSNSL